MDGMTGLHFVLHWALELILRECWFFQIKFGPKLGVLDMGGHRPLPLKLEYYSDGRNHQQATEAGCVCDVLYQ
jgi:hypothetical protein